MLKHTILTVACLIVITQTPCTLPAQAVNDVRLGPPNATLGKEFTRISAVRALADGRVLVSDAGDNKLYVVDFATQTATQIGRSGLGPNEYAALSTLWPLGTDSTLLPDPRAGRWLLLHGAEIVATVPPESPALRSGARVLFGAATSGHVLTTRASRNLEQSGTTMTGAADSTWIVRVTRATGAVDTLVKMRARASRITVATSGGRPQSVDIVTNPISVGEQAVLFLDGWTAIARFEPYRVDWVTPDGRFIRGPELPDRQVRVDERVKAWILAELAQQSGRPPRNPTDVPDWPEVIPPFVPSALLAASDGMLWIRKAATEPHSRTTYDVIDRQGRLVRRVSMAANERLIGFGAGVLFVVTADDDGIQRLQRH